jgi:hypothetical protein
MILNILDCRVEILAVGPKECAMLNNHFDLIEHRGDEIYTPGYYWAVRESEMFDIDADELFGPFASRDEAKAAATENLSY